eukprot:3501620-Prymnesium_polylepis.1
MSDGVTAAAPDAAAMAAAPAYADERTPSESPSSTPKSIRRVSFALDIPPDPPPAAPPAAKLLAGVRLGDLICPSLPWASASPSSAAIVDNEPSTPSLIDALGGGERPARRNDEWTEELGSGSGAARSGAASTHAHSAPAGASSDEPDIGDLSLLHFAAKKGSSGAVQLLLQLRPQQLERTDHRGRTALHACAAEGHAAAASAILARAAIAGTTLRLLRARDADRRTPLEIAWDGARADVVEAILAALLDGVPGA